MKDSSLYRAIEHEIIPFIRKPNRYTGLEVNRILKPNADLRFALAFPDLYEIGMSHLGMGILYHRLNSLDGVAAERVFLPDETVSGLLRSKNLPLFTLENRIPLHETDIIGISLSYEMAISGMLELLNLGKIPIHSADRDESCPIVIAGGPVVYNPEPFAEFVDLVIVGDGEEIVEDICDAYKLGKLKGLTRSQILDNLAKLTGVYYPAKYHIDENSNGDLIFNGIIDGGLNKIVEANIIKVLKPEYYPDKPVMPLLEVTHDRIALEVMRGCSRGCRFCHAGSVYRPVREREVEDVVAQAVKNIAATGYEEISLTSLSTSDYNHLNKLIIELRDAFRGKGISLAFPSLRADNFTEEMARAFPEGRKGNLTFAPEAGTQRLRDVINKNHEEADLLRAAKLAFNEGYNGLKLYFMIGLPTETKEDLDGIVDLVYKTASQRKNRGQKINVSVSTFVPKGHTPFQRYAQDNPEVLREKLQYLREKFRNSPARFNGHDPDNALFENAIARGDRKMSRVIERVWKMGGVLEAWNDRFEAERWYEAFREEGINPSFYARERREDEKLPWDHISKGISAKFLKNEWKKSVAVQTTENCREGKCTACGLMEFFVPGTKLCSAITNDETPLLEPLKSELLVDVVKCSRIRYKRGEGLRWTGHLDMVRIWDRLLRRSGLPVTYSQGFHPHMRLGFGPPLPVGLTSDDEYIDIDLGSDINAEELIEGINRSSVLDIEPVGIEFYEKRPQSLLSIVNQIDYIFYPPDSSEFATLIKEWLDSEEHMIERIKKGKIRKINIRTFVSDVVNMEEYWLLKLQMINGASVRLDELENSWGYEPYQVFQGAKRSAVWVDDNGKMKQPVEINNLVQEKGMDE